ncbi:short-chain dehydrogenase reductase SDR protein [Rutstroemia sp. NJR-2017a BVV2]|nr:short-chain dehydrogenase reductase SDR protein [Rutstroemia sp. NJR-2017a BVV2]
MARAARLIMDIGYRRVVSLSAHHRERETYRAACRPQLPCEDLRGTPGKGLGGIGPLVWSHLIRRGKIVGQLTDQHGDGVCVGVSMRALPLTIYNFDLKELQLVISSNVEGSIKSTIKMVSLSDVESSNSLIFSTLTPLVALFVGATSGIGEATLKKFAKYSKQPRAYFIGRSQDAADRIITECKALNSEGEYIFRRADVSLIKVVDEVCEEIKTKEKFLNILFLSQGVMSMDRSVTSENIHLLAALNYYSRLRFIVNLLPLLEQATSLRRVVTVGGGSKEGLLDATDFPALHVPREKLRGHLTTLITLGLEAVAKTAPGVSFVHDYPGTVPTALYRNIGGPPTAAIDTFVSIEESGQRHLFLATSAMFPTQSGQEAGVELPGRLEIATGTTGEIGSSVYSVGSDCESASPAAMELLAELRRVGMVEEVWRHTDSEFRRVTGVEEDS